MIVRGQRLPLHARSLSSFSIRHPKMTSINCPLLDSHRIPVLFDASTRAFPTFVSNAQKSSLLPFLARAFRSSIPLKSGKLKGLEIYANENPDDPKIQAQFFEVLVPFEDY